MTLDLNCDLGEGEPLSRTRGLMQWITSANVACGGHAGNVQTMETCVRLAIASGVNVGAHPGSLDRAGFGRSGSTITGAALKLLLLHQVGALERIAHAEGCRMHHVKLHGFLYHASDADESLGKAYVASVARWWPEARIYARAGGTVSEMAREAGLLVWEEAFLDRGYSNDGTLVPRTATGALLLDLGGMRERLRAIVSDHRVRAVSGEAVPIRPQTVCIHGDAPRAIARAAAARKFLELVNPY